LAVFVAWTLTARRAGRRYQGMLVEALRPSHEEITPRPSRVTDAVRARLRDELHEEARRCLLLRDPSELAESRARVLNLLSHLYDHDAIYRVAVHLAHPSREKRALARELLDVLLSREDRAALICLTKPEFDASF
jgi:hypothetical protein